MRKTIICALVLVMALSMAAPALAYTTNTTYGNNNSLYTLDIHLVEYSGSDYLSRFLSAAPVNRGYAKNEIVAAVGSVKVPAYADVYGDGFDMLKLSATNVTLNVVDNYGTGNNINLMHTFPDSTTTTPWLTNVAANGWTLGGDNNMITHPIAASGINSIPDVNSAKTYSVLFFGKVLADDASMSIALSRNARFNTMPASSTVSAAGVAYTVTDWLTLGTNYLVFRSGTQYLLLNDPPANYTGGASLGTATLEYRISTDSRGRTNGLFMYVGSTEYRVLLESSGANLMFIYTGGTKPANVSTLNGAVTYGTSQYSALLAFYNATFESVLGLTVRNEGNILRDRDWLTVAGVGDISESVDIQPWTPYVQVPERIVIDPPKTGNYSFLGFVLLLLAGAAAVTLKKVRA